MILLFLVSIFIQKTNDYRTKNGMRATTQPYLLGSGPEEYDVLQNIGGKFMFVRTYILLYFCIYIHMLVCISISASARTSVCVCLYVRPYVYA